MPTWFDVFYALCYPCIGVLLLRILVLHKANGFRLKAGEKPVIDLAQLDMMSHQGCSL